MWFAAPIAAGMKTGELIRRREADGWYRVPATEVCRSTMTTMRYAVVIERGAQSYGAYVPDLPGVISVGDTEEDVMVNVREAITLHLEGLLDAGDHIPEPKTLVTVIDTA
jgi:predicted RNase H-like HicB family nuclease